MQTNNLSNNLSMNEFVYKKIYVEFRKHCIMDISSACIDTRIKEMK